MDAHAQNQRTIKFTTGFAVSNAGRARYPLASKLRRPFHSVAYEIVRDLSVNSP
jgi:hypothetical protein